MSASRHAWPRSAAAVLVLLAGLACGGGGGGGGGQPNVVVSSIDPSSGFSGHQTEVVITGDNFLISPTSSTIRAWLDTAELLDVTRDPGDPVHKLHATVPAGLDPGSKTLKVQNAYGSTGSLANAFTVQATAGAALAIVSPLTLTPGTVNVGQPFTVQAQVKNAGTAAATGVVAALELSSTDGAAGSITAGPDPTSIATLAPGATATFTWTVDPTAAGTLAVEAKADGQDVFSGNPVSADPVSALETVQLPAGLTATVTASNPRVAGSNTVDVGQAIAVTFSVTNGGMSTADLTTVALTESGTATGTSCTGPVPGMPQSVGAGETRSFTFSCTASGAGTLVIGGNVAGTDHTSHAPLSDTATPDTVTVQTPPVLAASLARDPAVISLGQTVSVTLTISNTGGSSATLTGLPVPTAAVGTDQTKVSCGGPNPTTLATVHGGGGTATYTWTCAPIATGTLNMGATVSASNANTLVALPVATAPNVTATVQNPATLVAVTGATPTTVDSASPPPGPAGQSIAVTFDLINGGTATADVTSVVPTAVDPTGAVTATCTAPLRSGQPLPALIPILAGGSVRLTWSCVPGQISAGTVTNLVLSGTVAATDHNSGVALNPTVSPNTVTVQTPAAVTQTAFTANPATVDTGQSTAIALTLRNSGGATAHVTVTPSATPASGVTCTPTPAPAQTIAGTGTLPLGWTCTSTVAGVHVYGATVTALDVNTNTSSAVAVTAPSVTVQTPASLTASYTVHPPSANTNQAAAFTLRVTNTGDATANVSSVTPAPSAGLTCGNVTPAPATTTILGHAFVDFGFSCSAAAAGVYTLGTSPPTVTVSAADANSGASADASVGQISLTVQAPAQLTAGLVPARTTADTNQAVGVTLTLTNNGGATAHVSALSVAIAGVAGSCTAPSPAAPFDVLGGGASHAVPVTWTCTPSAVGTATLDATVAASDTNVPGSNISPAVTGASVTVQAPGLLAISVVAVPTAANTGQLVPVTATFTNNGGAAVNVSALAGSIGPLAGSCGTYSRAVPFPVPAGGAGQAVTVTWSCSASATGAATLGATVTAADANGVAVTPTVTTDSLAIQTPAATSLTGALSGVPSTVVANQAVPVTFTLTNATGGATAQVSAISPTITGVAGSCTPVTVTPFNLAGGDPGRVFNWTCTPTASGTVTLGATVTATDLNLGPPTFNPAVPAASATVVLALTATLAGTPTPNPLLATAPGSVALTLAVTNPNTAAAQVTGVTPAATGTAPITCSGPVSPAASPTTPVAVPGSTTQQFTWTCTYAGTGGTAGQGSQLSATVQASLGGANVSPVSIAGMPVNATLN